ncbi:MAG: metallophosphoesterase family protein [Thermodesulfobacteriota bacterium]
MGPRILATADIHLGRKSSAVPGDLEVVSTRYTWERIVETAIQNSVDALVIAGDLVDRDNRFYEAIGPLQSGFHKLNQAGIEVYLTAGNHDYDVLPQIAANSMYGNVHLLGQGGEWEVQRLAVNRGQCQFVGWSFPGQFVAEDPLLSLQGSELDPDIPTVGVLHGYVDDPEGKYAPLSMSNLAKHQVEAWILGHVHTPQRFKQQSPYIAYAGSPHAMSPSEYGVHGLVLLQVESRDEIRTTDIPISPTRYEDLAIDVSSVSSEAEFRNRVVSGLLNSAGDKLQELDEVYYLVFDIYLKGDNSRANEIDSWKYGLADDYEQELENGTRLLVRKVVNEVKPAVSNLEELANDASPAGKLAETILAIQNGDSTPFLEDLIQDWKANLQKINFSGTYRDLNKEGRVCGPFDARQYILRECNRLLSELLSQQNS